MNNSARRQVAEMYVPLLLAIAVCQLAGVIGTFFTASSINSWYPTLVKPSFSPPNWLFAPVWITLHTLMGIALYRIWRLGVGDRPVREAVIVFAAQLVFNTLWSIVFFGVRDIGFALGVILVLWALIATCIILFRKLDSLAAFLL